MNKDRFCVKGINLVKTLEIEENKLLTILNNQPIFEVPLRRIKHCNGIKNELSVELIQNFEDEREDNLIEIRYYVH